MKKLTLALLLALASVPLFGANVALQDLPNTAVLPASNDYGVLSNSTRTAKILMTGIGFVTPTRTTLAAFSITGIGDGIGVEVLGATAAADGGGAYYVWSASSTASANGNTVIQPASLPGTGRWLKATGGVGTPGSSTLGGIFSNAGVSHQWVKTINTDGSVTLAQPAATDVSGLGGAATLNVGTITGTVAAGDDSRIVGAAQKSANGSDFTSASTVRTNLGLGTIAIQSAGSVAITGGTIAVNPGSAGAPSLTFAGSTAGFYGDGSNGMGINTGGGTRITISSTGAVLFAGPVTMNNNLGILGGLSVAGNISGAVYSSTSNANIISSKVNFHNPVVNIMDYGAVGDNGATDNTTFINNAISAAGPGAGVYIPKGIFGFSGTINVTGRSDVTIFGDGWGSILLKTANYGGVGVAVGSGSAGVTLRDFAFTTNCTTRSGGHLVVLNGNDNAAYRLWLDKSPEFALFAATSAADASGNVIVQGCKVTNSFADGIHFGAVRHGQISGNEVINSADDAIAVASDVVSNAGYYNDDVQVTGNHVTSSGSRGILVQESSNVSVSGNFINGTADSGINVSVYHSTTYFNTNISIKGNTLINVAPTTLGRAGILTAYCHFLQVSENSITIPSGSSMNGIFLCDSNSVDVQGNGIWTPATHGITGYNDTTTGPGDIGPVGRTFSANWSDWMVDGNTLNGGTNVAGYAINLVAPSTATINRPVVAHNRISNWANTTNYIGYAQCLNGKIILNVGNGTSGIVNGGGNSGMTVTPNY